MRTFKGLKAPYRGVAFHPDGRRLFVAHYAGLVTCWDLKSGSELARLEPKKGSRSGRNRVEAIAISPDGHLLAAAGDSLTVWDCVTWQPVAGFEVPDSFTLRDVIFTVDGTRLLGGLDHTWLYNPQNMSLAMWDTSDGNLLPTSWAKRGAVRSLNACSDGESVFASTDYQFLRWHLPSQQEYPSKPTCPGDALAVSSATGMLAGGSYRTVAIQDADGARLLARWEAHKKGVFALAFSPDGKLLVTGSGDEVVKVWDVAQVAEVLADSNAEPLNTVPLRGAFDWGIGPVRALAFSPDGLTAAAVGERVKFVVWDVE